MLHTLPDGTRLRIRPVEPADGPRLAAGFAKLSQESVRRRFLAAKPRLTAAELRYLSEVDGVHHVALVAVLDEDPEQIAAVARCVRLAPGASTAEFAIVVGEPVQRQGLASELTRRLADAAWAVGIRRFTASTLAENVAVRRLLAAVAVRVEQRMQEGSVRELVAELPDPAAGPSAPPLAA